MTARLGVLTFERKVKLFTDAKPPLNINDFLAGDEGRCQKFARQLVERLCVDGFFYLKRPLGLLRPHDLDDPCEHYFSAYEKALRATPHPKKLLRARSVFETGYYRTWFPNSAEVRQPIEAFMAKPDTWQGLRKRRVSPPLRDLLELTERSYRAAYLTAFILLEALELGYGMRRRALRALFGSHRDGAVRLVKYHEPYAPATNSRVIAHVSRPHVDKSFFTINFGESRPGLIWIAGERLRLLPNVAGHWLVTSGLFSHGLTRHTSCPVTPFFHTVLNDGERTVALAFVTPEGDLHNRQLNEWPVPQFKASPRRAREKIRD